MCDYKFMLDPGAKGSDVVVIPQRTLWWAVDELCRALPHEVLRKLKVRSGEDLAAISTTAFLACAPTSVDCAGEPDLIFDLSHSKSERSPISSMGLANKRFADFEVKSIGVWYRKFDATIDQSLGRGEIPMVTTFTAAVTTVNEVLAGEGLNQIDRALRQLNKKVRVAHSKNIFLIAHPFDYPVVEMDVAPIVAHLLNPLDGIVGVDTVWVMWPDVFFVMWSSHNARWVNLLFDSREQSKDHSSAWDDLELLQQVQVEFQRRIDGETNSPYIFRLE